MKTTMRINSCARPTVLVILPTAVAMCTIFYLKLAIEHKPSQSFQVAVNLEFQVRHAVWQHSCTTASVKVMNDNSLKDTNNTGKFAVDPRCKDLPSISLEQRLKLCRSYDSEHVTNHTHRNNSSTGVLTDKCSYNFKDYVMCRLVVVTGFSSDHFAEAHNLIASVQHYLPYTRIIVYDLGLNEAEKCSLLSYCNVEYRKFRFNNYPRHASNLHTYAFKPLIVDEVSKEYEVMMWADASIRIVNHNLRTLIPYLKKFPFIPGPRDGSPIVSLTHDGMLQYLNMTQSRGELYANFKTTFQSGSWIIWLNNEMKTKFISHWTDCGMHKECIAPNGSKLWPCNYRKRQNYNCHRYDQSALNMILIREFGLENVKRIFHQEVASVIEVERWKPNAKHKLTISVCKMA